MAGGDTCSPGFAIYRRGANMGAVVSTGNFTWEVVGACANRPFNELPLHNNILQVEVVGALPTNNTWSNLAIRWEQPKFQTQEEYQALVQQGVQTTDMGGLQVTHLPVWVERNLTAQSNTLQFLINLEAVGHVILASDECDCSATNPCAGGTPEGNVFDQPHMMLGCHATMQNQALRNFSTGILDEEAFWAKYVNDTYSAYFLGGYRKCKIPVFREYDAHLQELFRIHFQRHDRRGFAQAAHLYRPGRGRAGANGHHAAGRSRVRQRGQLNHALPEHQPHVCHDALDCIWQ